jgi:hypothetical protein
MNTKQFFHYISYLQYPMMAVGLYFILQPYFNDFDGMFHSLNRAMVFIGLGVSLSTLQDTTMTQNEASRKIWESPKKGKLFLILMSAMTLFFIVSGLIGIFASDEAILSELSLGLVVIGIGFLGLLKAGSEMFENHRLDKNPN